MKRRDFIKTSICLGSVCTVCAGIPLCKKKVIPQIKERIAEQKFIYKTEKDLPEKICLDICNLCQLNCPACWMRMQEEEIKEKGGGFGYVSFETFKNFIDKYPFIKEIELSCNGEIFLNPDLDKIIKYSYDKNIQLTAFRGVNLNTLTEEMAENLVKYKFSGMTVSIDAATPETYPIYRRGGDFNTVINNIKTINKFKKKYGVESPYLIYKFILFGHNEHEIAQAKELAKKLNMQIQFDVNYFPEYSPLKDPQKALTEAGLNTKENYIEHNLENYNEDKLQYFPCKLIFEQPQFNYNGDLMGCCHFDLLQSYQANVFKDGMLKTLNSDKFLYTKLMLSDMSVPSKPDIPCSECSVYKELQKNHATIKI